MAKKQLTMTLNKTNVRYYGVKPKITHFLLTVIYLLVPDLAKRKINTHFFKPTVYPLTPLERWYLENAARFQIHVHGKKIQCWKWGQGPGILFVHGWNGRGIQFRYFFEALLDAGYSLITYDAPAHGESEGQITNYFELSDTVRSFLDPSRGFNIQGIIAYSLCASAAINCLSKVKSSVVVALIAPALKLKEILFNTFNRQGVPKRLYQSLIAEMEKEYGYDLYQDNPYHLLKEIDSKVILVHDKDDRTIPYVDSKKLTDQLNNVYLYTTEGLGHKRVLKDKNTIDCILGYFFRQRLTDDCLRPSQF